MADSLWLVPSFDAAEPMVVALHSPDGTTISDRSGIFTRSGSRVAPSYVVREAFLHGGLLTAISPGELFHAHKVGSSKQLPLPSTDHHELLADEMVSWQKDAPRTFGVRAIQGDGALGVPQNLGAIDVDADSASSCVASDGTKGALFVSPALQAVAFVKDAKGWLRLAPIAVGAKPGSRVTTLCERGRITTTSISRGVFHMIRCSRAGCETAQAPAEVADGFSGATMAGNLVVWFDFERLADRSDRLRARIAPITGLADAQAMYPACRGAAPGRAIVVELLATADGALLVLAGTGQPAVLCAMFVDRDGRVSAVSAKG